MGKDPNLAHLRPLFQVGERMLVKAGPVPKGSSPYRGPYVITKVLGCYTFCLSDGQRWSARVMKRWYDPDEDNKEVTEMVIEGTRDPGPDEE